MRYICSIMKQVITKKRNQNKRHKVDNTKIDYFFKVEPYPYSSLNFQYFKLKLKNSPVMSSKYYS